MPGFAELDAITLDDLRATGTTKWSREDGAIGAFVAEMDFGVAPPITDALHREVDRGAFAYLPRRYLTAMQSSVGRYLRGACGWDVDPARVHQMPDVVAAYRAAIRYFSRPGSAVIVPTPAYMPFLTVPPDEGREVIEVPMRRDGAYFSDDLDAIERAFDDGGGLLVLCNPHNPTGRVFTRAELQAIEELVQRKGGRVFSDEIWMPLVLGDRRHIPYASIGPAAAGHSITAMAASKAFNIPGLKCAQLITTNDADEAVWQRVGFMPMHGAANLGLAATAAAFDRGGVWLSDVRAYLERNLRTLTEFLAERLPHVGFRPPEGTYVAWLDLSAYRLDGPPAEFLLEHAGVACTEGTDCGAAGAGHVRFIAAMPRPLMLEALERMAKALEAVPLRG
ncbi:MalY/PatB family protein [Tomitella fengzijianii]|uniref:cysteine-S-conjugate beta-lyase n=1 Tax=Tomitella fengzijianii TaxID=2597660 RepID=A0A516X366_9ACTN|nr:aminotransferase class I/II-fold pyridoxal phosphate-dependent enzyme [Tomitella fengzijianii]QDQ97498.1 aminotransferase class I/II-fold pyridoxal phosphate-dependent enzyme [Tomitella fengzijianii]